MGADRNALKKTKNNTISKSSLHINIAFSRKSIIVLPGKGEIAQIVVLPMHCT